MSPLASKLKNYQAKANAARLAAALNLSENVGFKITMSTISNRVLDIVDGWSSSLHEHQFDWRAIKDSHREPTRLEISMFVGDRLCGVALGLLKNSSVELRFLEGSPDIDCPMRGIRITAALECAANYAQGCGRREIRIQPINDALVELYESQFGFVRVAVKGQEPYFKKEL